MRIISTELKEIKKQLIRSMVSVVEYDDVGFGLDHYRCNFCQEDIGCLRGETKLPSHHKRDCKGIKLLQILDYLISGEEP
jgi:hypothetical protein